MIAYGQTVKNTFTFTCENSSRVTLIGCAGEHKKLKLCAISSAACVHNLYIQSTVVFI